MADWSPTQYLKFKNERTQPALDLAMRVKDLPIKTIADIGCGPGNSTQVLSLLFPHADILGIDHSESMIEKARKENPCIRFELCDASSLKGKYDLLFSNACLQWIPDHETLIPVLMDKLKEGGVLAVQVPMNGEEPLFRLIEEIVGEPKWNFPEGAGQTNGTLTPLEYYDILAKCASSFDIWETKYHHTLPNHRALVEFVKGSRLRPYLAILGDEKGRELEAEISERAKALYPVMADGKVALGFRRFFFTAKK